MKGYLVYLIMALLLFTKLLSAASPERPKNVPMAASWKAKHRIWTFGSIAKGSYRIWYENGSIQHREVIIIGKRIKRIEKYYINGSILRKGYDIEIISNGEKAWIAFGKWVDYYKNGNIKMIQCYTPYEDSTDGLVDALCGDEIHYDEKGKEIKRISHKLKCQYGCDFYKE